MIERRRSLSTRLLLVACAALGAGVTCQGKRVGILEASAGGSGGGGGEIGQGGTQSDGQAGAAGEAATTSSAVSSSTGGSSGTTASGAAGGAAGAMLTSGGAEAGASAADACMDGALGQSETDVDCGGVCDPCPLDKHCVYDADCQSRSCAFGSCALHLYLVTPDNGAQPYTLRNYRPAISGDGSVIACETVLVVDGTQTQSVTIHNRATQMTRSLAVNGTHVSVSGDGTTVAFESSSSDIVADDTNQVQDAFVFDSTLDSFERISVNDAGEGADDASYVSHLSANGNLVPLSTRATNLGASDGSSQVYLRNRTAGTTELISTTIQGIPGNGDSGSAAISADERWVSFSSSASDLVFDDTNDASDVFLKDRQTGAVERVSITTGGGEGNGPSFEPRLSADGWTVVFSSAADNLVEGDTNGFRDIFVRDRRQNRTSRVSVATDGTQADNNCFAPDVSDDGRYVVFYTPATTLVPNTSSVALVHDRVAGRTERVAFTIDNEPSLGGHQLPRISGDGKYIVTETGDLNLFVGVTNIPFISVFANPLRPL